MKDGLHGTAAMARPTKRTAEDGDPRTSVPTERAEPRDLVEPRELSLEEVLKSYEQPINEEQAWAVCYQCCSGLRVPRPPAAGVSPSPVKGPSSILLHRDGTVALRTRGGGTLLRVTGSAGAGAEPEKYFQTMRSRSEKVSSCSPSGGVWVAVKAPITQQQFPSRRVFSRSRALKIEGLIK